jgi:hypothetical protein
MMFVYATSDLNEGDELTANYVSPMEFFVERKKRLQRWAFKCECKLCILDRSEPEAEKQRQELIARMEAIKFVNYI